MSDKAEDKTVFSALSITSEEVELMKACTTKWAITMDKLMVNIQCGMHELVMDYWQTAQIKY